MILTCVRLAVIFCELSTVANRHLAMLDAFLILVAASIEAAGLLGQFVPLALLTGTPDAAPRPQRHTLVSVASGLSDRLWLLMFGIKSAHWSRNGVSVCVQL